MCLKVKYASSKLYVCLDVITEHSCIVVFNDHAVYITPIANKRYTATPSANYVGSTLVA